MKRRQLMRYAGASLLTAVGTSWASGFQAFHAATPNTSLSVKWLGHTSFLLTGGGQRVLVNPFRKLGCTAGYRAPKVEADLVLVSSLLLDEGAIEGLPGKPKFLYEAGVYQLSNFQVQGIAVDHDREGGRRFGKNVTWRWKQAGVNILHLGGATGSIGIEEKILMGTPDVLFIPVGGGPKAYTPQEAKQAIQVLNPKLVIPTHYRTQAADGASCDIMPIDDFLTLMDGTPVARLNSDTIAFKPTDLPEKGPVIRVMSYKF